MRDAMPRAKGIHNICGVRREQGCTRTILHSANVSLQCPLAPNILGFFVRVGQTCKERRTELIIGG
jgi:hypothetical protein